MAVRLSGYEVIGPLFSARSWVDPRAAERPEGSGKSGNPIDLVENRNGGLPACSTEHEQVSFRVLQDHMTYGGCASGPKSCFLLHYIFIR
jgi:hypothetical protein